MRKSHTNWIREVRKKIQLESGKWADRMEIKKKNILEQQVEYREYFHLELYSSF